MAIWDRYTGQATSLEVESWTGKAFYIRSFCDDPLGGIYVAKDPVCILSVDPITEFVNTNIAWDISNSVSATGTLDTFTITWGGATDIGNISGDSFGVDPESGNVQFTTAGNYTVTAYVVDTLGARSKEQEVDVEILDTTELDPVGVDDKVYIGVTDDGLWIRSLASIASSNTGLSGGNLNFRSVKLHPSFKDLASDKRHIWACTALGLVYSTDGGATWTAIALASFNTPENAANDSPAPATADLDQIDIEFDPTDDRTVYVLRTDTSPTRAWLYKSTDYGTTWTNVQIKGV